MVADILITEKSFGAKNLFSNIRFSINDREKIGIIGRNGVGKSTLFGVLAGLDKDYSGEINIKPGAQTVYTSQEYHEVGEKTVLQYILDGLPEYAKLSAIIENYPKFMGDNLNKINEYTQAIERFNQKGFYQIEDQIIRELEKFQLHETAHKTFSALSGGQKRLAEVIKIMHSKAQLALIDEPTNHMDFVAKEQFIDWFKEAPEAILVITHDRDILREVERIIEITDGVEKSYKGNYDAFLKQNAITTGSQMNEFEMIERRINNLKSKVIEYQRYKEKARNPGTIQRFKRLEDNSRKELKELQDKVKPTFWIDKESVSNLNYKTAGQYEKYKAKNVRLNLHSDNSRSKHVLVSARNLNLGYEKPVLDNVNLSLGEGEIVEIRGRNGAGKTTFIKSLLGIKEVKIFSGEIKVEEHVRIGFYEQEVSKTYFELTLEDAIERMYLDKNLPISTTKIRNLISDYLFTESDSKTPIKRLSGGQKARFQIISMLANNPQLLILDEPTNHLDLPSIEELETALSKYSGAVIYVSHDNYFRNKIAGEIIEIGSQ